MTFNFIQRAIATANMIIICKEATIPKTYYEKTFI